MSDPAMLGLIAGLRARTVNQRDDRDPELRGELHEAERLSIAFGEGHASVGGGLFLRGPAALLRNDENRLAVKFREASDDRRIIPTPAISVQLQESRRHPRNVMPGSRPAGMPR